MPIAALITWVITAGFGSFMLARWISHGGLRAGGNRATHFPPGGAGRGRERILSGHDYPDVAAAVGSLDCRHGPLGVLPEQGRRWSEQGAKPVGHRGRWVCSSKNHDQVVYRRHVLLG